MVVTNFNVSKATAQIPFLPILQSPQLGINDSDKTIVNDSIYLDGRRLFQIADTRANLAQRLEDIQQALDRISQNYFQTPDAKLNVEIDQAANASPIIRVNGNYLMTVTQEDANIRQQDPESLAEEFKQLLLQKLPQAKQERKTQFLMYQGKIAAATILGMIIISWGVYKWQCRSRKISVQPTPPATPATKPITVQLNREQNQHIQEAKRRLFQLGQAMIWGGGSFFILGLFPYTRSLQIAILRGAKIPLQVGLMLLLTYVAVRLIYALTDSFASALINSSTLLTPETTERLQLRVSTISGVTKSIATFALLILSTLLTLTVLGIDVIPLLAGASLIGVALSLASQSLIKDAINGFLIILEDQYALGDVIAVGEVGGLVENLNLRMTQVRDSEGRLITIPNSEIKIVANLSSRWSRADLNIPVSYQTNIDKALELIEHVALKMDLDPLWQEQIVETPKVLGVDNFGDRGLIIRVWIKTQPLKQWDVAREFRRRLKIAFDKAGVSIPLPQQAIWVNDAELLKSHFDDKVN
ncbi:mechanosensitive ion channel family protein [Scytonema hofmannii FACHB-248]|uniref:Mechanosensitive ion channel family protein n=1 Tax=Scytonema hofmannii FACHB-248 TaxID=1842502 RepID=A0ABR8GJW4_9CYAN|nr:MULTISPECIES: mechanosensitive ion channel family protein [Nostocales]MBD2603679.1 mechanosensitive ion channel family protein [Scytonema hofmannii FACHB-248]